MVCDFRTQDVQLGGQGAPLVPIGDALLFGSFDACVNLGGFANISYQQGDHRIAFDVCPVNIVLNHYTNKLGLPFDEGGKIAAQGAFNQDLFDVLNSLEYYHQGYPKSLGLEWVQEHIFPLIDAMNLEVSSILNTFTKQSAFQLSRALMGKNTVLITGGGAYNSYLISELKQQVSISIAEVDDGLINFKEALVFAFLGLLRIDNQVNCLKSVTGAPKDHSSGVVFLP